jgi:hypothetical protein
MAIEDTTGDFSQPIEIYRGVSILVRTIGNPRQKEFYGDLSSGQTLRAETPGGLKAKIDIAAAQCASS